MKQAMTLWRNNLARFLLVQRHSLEPTLESHKENSPKSIFMNIYTSVENVPRPICIKYTVHLIKFAIFNNVCRVEIKSDRLNLHLLINENI